MEWHHCQCCLCSTKVIHVDNVPQCGYMSCSLTQMVAHTCWVPRTDPVPSWVHLWILCTLTFTAHAFCASLLLNYTTHWLVQCRVSLCSHVMPCKSTTSTGTSAHVTVYLLYHPYSVLCVACVFWCHMSVNLPPGRPGLLPSGLWRRPSRDCTWTTHKRYSGPEHGGWCE